MWGLPPFLLQISKMEGQYGTTDCYRHMFADILADVASGDAKRDFDTSVAIMEGFELAIIDWMKYHEDAAKSYRELHGRFLLCKNSTDK